MAVTSLWRVKGYVGKVVMYAMNPEKTTETVEVSAGKTRLTNSQRLILKFLDNNRLHVILSIQKNPVRTIPISQQLSD